jgi:hypothetical protein
VRFSEPRRCIFRRRSEAMVGQAAQCQVAIRLQLSLCTSPRSDGRPG